ncbi:MAG TPA: tetratricopeptide repeat protein [Methylomirabilota bacterium]|jgi:TolA-binding protein
MTRGLRALPILLLLVACSTARPTPWTGGSPGRGGSGGATRMVGYADDLAERGDVQEAFRVYERVLHDYPADPASASALYWLGRLQAAPESQLRNYRAAHAAFSRLLSEYPQSRWESEARAWRAVLGDLLAREEETARVKIQLERLRRTDLDLERRR